MFINIILIIVSLTVGALLWGALGIAPVADSSSAVGPWVNVIGLWFTGAIIVYPVFLAIVSATERKRP